MTEPLDAEQERIRARLRALAETGPMPEDVVARVEGALAAERSRPRPAHATGADADADAAEEDGLVAAVSLAERRLRRAARWRRGLGVAAAVAVLGGGVWAVQERGPSTADSGAASGSAAGPANESYEPGDLQATSGAAVVSSETDYTSPDQLTAATALMDTHDTATSADGPYTMLDAPGGGSSSPTSRATDPSLADAPLACAVANGVTAGSVSRVELARWQGRPAALLTVDAGSSGAEVLVYALDCRPGDLELARSTAR
ncbi:hypothetical protein ACFFKU_01565 [Kineococcus gynurae]|uniref:Uncharacterized protein n=1 Tax=Kineococcus gynurae TaxID=452979 RepID=A0ABV5LT31_9ACTN